MKPKFNVILLEEVWDFLDTIDDKSKEKILYNYGQGKICL